MGSLSEGLIAYRVLAGDQFLLCCPDCSRAEALLLQHPVIVYVPVKQPLRLLLFSL